VGKKILAKRTRKFKMPEITLIPLIDAALTLLIIFIIAAPMVQNGIKVDLPQGQSKEVGSQQELVVTISKEEKLFFNSYPITKDELVSAVQKALVQHEDMPIYVRADETVPYGKVIEIVDKLKIAGVKYVAMSTRPT
jgi:biopolymer transport protein TolR